MQLAKRAARVVARAAVKSPPGTLARSLVLQNPVGQQALNHVYERLGPSRPGQWLRLAFDEPALFSCDFVWRTRVGGRELLLPVDSALAHGSWHTATNWS